MQELEDTLLHRLSTVEGSLIDDQQVVSVLKSTKQMALEVQEKLNVAAETEAKINAAREEYRAVATRGSILYFLITEMSMVNIMYQTSLKQFLVLFNESMAKSAKTAVPSKRIGNIIDYMTFRVFKYVTQGLYENDKFLFTLLLAIKINLTMGTISEKEFQTFIKGGAALDMNSAEPKPKKWIPDITWLNLVQLSNLKQFQNILDQVTRNDKAWKTWYDEDAPEACTIPDGYSASLLPFSRLLLVRSWCPDRTIAQSRSYVASAIGNKYTESLFLNLAAILEESDCRTPLVCLLSQGSDPSEAIARLAAKFEFACSSVSMGQGQELHARRLLAENMPTGGWILLQNCHLGLEFMSELLETLSTTATVHETFRCWMTTEMHPKFPITMLQASIKFTNDPPMGIKASLKRTFAQISQDQLEANSAAQWRPMLYTVAFLHAVVQERRKFGPLGWNIPYEFNNSDFTSTVQFIQNHLEEVSPKKGISWATVRYMIGEVQYGGRVTDDFDKRLINTFARVWFSDSMFAKEFEFHEGYQVIASTNIEQLRLSIEKLPSMDSPEVFRLHPNANIAYQTNRANKIFSTILNIQPKDVVVGQGDTREMIVYKIVTDMLQKLPHDYQPHHVKERLNKMGALSSMTIFLRQEIDCMQKVISTVRATLCDLRLAIDGTIVMSDSLRGAVDSLSNAMIPDIWLRVSWESATLGFWFMELIERNMQLTTWLDHGRPKCFWMSGFFNPQGFLTAMRQEITRAHKGWSLDKVVLQNEVTKCMREDITAPPAEGVYISGLHLDGASWDRRSSRLAEPIPKVLFTPMPVVRMYADVVDSTTGSQQFYECPVYKKPSRTGLNYIATLALSAGGMSPDHWCLRGVALLCDVHT
ncbi:PREDICTED: dynein heavy chain 8, axonemal-like isoform X2 [Priapulus caudatus]|nr:PREDICTED: dynein heavy chain 8, axonemal-like isoform X2 [Priapulus caudatus]